jgi:hypothetical protein
MEGKNYLLSTTGEHQNHWLPQDRYHPRSELLSYSIQNILSFYDGFSFSSKQGTEGTETTEITLFSGI